VNGVNASTATGTTATASVGVPYTGRFAPSPTGALHLGSLSTATASFLDARAQGGRWLLRIDDLDTPRVVPGAADAMLRTLESLGFRWDGEVTWQSHRLERYDAALAHLRGLGSLYACSCSRRDLGATDDAGGYPGTCRAGPAGVGPTATRFRADLHAGGILVDRLQGELGHGGGSQGDPIVRRRDGLHAYQLAVVVDDADAGVTHVVRGADLLGSTGWQRALQRALQLPEPQYAHVPLVTEADGTKLAKSASASAIAGRAGPALIHEVLGLLCQDPPAQLARASIAEVWDWAISHWRPESLRGLAALALAPRLY